MSRFEITENHAAKGKACAACRAPLEVGQKIKRRPERDGDATDPDVARMTGGNVAIHDPCPMDPETVVVAEALDVDPKTVHKLEIAPDDAEALLDADATADTGDLPGAAGVGEPMNIPPEAED